MARGARAPPHPQPQLPTPACAPPPRRRRRRPRRSWDPLPARGPGGRGSAGPGAAWKERESKSKASSTPSFPNFAPCGGRRPAAPRVPTARASGRKKRDGAGAGAEAEGARGRGESPATSVKTWGRWSAGRRRRRKRRRRGKEGARGREARAEGQLFHPVSSAGGAGSGLGAPPPCAGGPAGMGPSSRKSIGCQEGTAVGARFLSLSPPSRG